MVVWLSGLRRAVANRQGLERGPVGSNPTTAAIEFIIHLAE